MDMWNIRMTDFCCLRFQNVLFIRALETIFAADLDRLYLSLAESFAHRIAWIYFETTSSSLSHELLQSPHDLYHRCLRRSVSPKHEQHQHLENISPASLLENGIKRGRSVEEEG